MIKQIIAHYKITSKLANTDEKSAEVVKRSLLDPIVFQETRNE